MSSISLSTCYILENHFSFCCPVPITFCTIFIVIMNPKPSVLLTTISPQRTTRTIKINSSPFKRTINRGSRSCFYNQISIQYNRTLNIKLPCFISYICLYRNLKNIKWFCYGKCPSVVSSIYF